MRDNLQEKSIIAPSSTTVTGKPVSIAVGSCRICRYGYSAFGFPSIYLLFDPHRKPYECVFLLNLRKNIRKLFRVTNQRGCAFYEANMTCDQAY